MKTFLEYIAKSIAKFPDEVRIEEVQEEYNYTLQLFLNNEDKPLLIGKLGRNIKAIRDVVSIIAMREGKKVYIKVMD